METYTIRRHDDGWHISNSKSTDGPYQTEEAATEEAFRRADAASRVGKPSAVRIEGENERCRVLHRYGAL